MRVWLALLVLSTGCFLGAGTGVFVPTQPGYGDFGLPLSVTSGVETETPYGRIGGSGEFRAFASPSTAPTSLAWAAGGLQLRNDINLVPLWRRWADTGTPYYYQHLVLVTTLSGGLGEGVTYRDEETSSAKYFDIYIGVGVSDHRRTKKLRWFTWSGGVAANRIWFGDRDPAWFVGVAATMGMGMN